MMNISLTPISVSFRKLNDELINEGLYTTHLSYYYIQLLKLLVLFTAVVSLIVYNRYLPPSSRYLTTYSFKNFRNKNWLPIVSAAVILAVFWQQLAFIVHDSGHNSITHNSAIDNVVGVTLGNLFSGISIGTYSLTCSFTHSLTR
jgi:delta8-fatty-acid desaturase